jgi:hypothetical protein
MEDFGNLLAFDRMAEDGTRVAVYINYSASECALETPESRADFLLRRASRAGSRMFLGPYGIAIVQTD